MPHELQPFLRQLAIEGDEWIGTIRFWQGHLEGKRITLVQSGIGKVYAAAATQMLISRCAPDGIFSCGAAGGLDPQMQIGDVLVAERTAHHDYGFVVSGTFIPYGIRTEQNGNATFLTTCPSDAGLLKAARAVNPSESQPFRVRYGVIVTGDQMILSSAKRQWLAEQFDAQAVDMESVAIAQIAAMHEVPFLAIRGISDLADEHLPLDLTKLDPQEFGGFAAASLTEKARLLAKAITYFARHPSLFTLSLQARQQIKRAANNSASFTLDVVRSLYNLFDRE